MRYFLTGITGFIGGKVAQQLVAAGHEVTALVRAPEKAQGLSMPGIQLVKGDVTDKASMRAPMTGVDGVYHIAGWYKIGAKDKSQGQAINVDGTRNVLELMAELGIAKGVYTSTVAVNSDTRGVLVDERYEFRGQHVSEYDRTKAAAHAIAQGFIMNGLPLVIVMPGLVYGPGDTSSVRTTLIQFLQRKLPMIPQKTAFSWGYIDDIAQGHLGAMQTGRQGESYIVAGPDHTLVYAMQLAQEITGIPAPRAVSPSLFATLSPVMGVVEKVAPLPDSYTAEGLRVLAGVTYIGDASKAKAELGFRPRSLRAGLEITLAHEMKLLGMSAPQNTK